MKRVLLAGISGYLGSYIAKELQNRAYYVRAIARNPERQKQNNIEANEIVIGEVTQPDSIKDCCNDIDVLISTIGITRQKDGLTYMDVDYQGNKNLLNEAKKKEVKEKSENHHESKPLPENVIPLWTYKKNRDQSEKDKVKTF